MINCTKGQSTVEYIILVAAVIAVAIGFLSGGNGPFQTKLNDTMTTLTNQMTNVVNNIGG